MWSFCYYYICHVKINDFFNFGFCINIPISIISAIKHTTSKVQHQFYSVRKCFTEKAIKKEIVSTPLVIDIKLIANFVN